MKNIAKLSYVIIIIAIIILLSVGCTMSLEQEYELLTSGKLKSSYVHADYIMNINDMREVVGYSDYVFVGKITEYKGTDHDTPSGIPLTIYSVKVLDNIKGSLIQDSDVEVNITGGLAKNYRRVVSVNEVKPYPKIDDYYIFIVGSSDTGQLYASTEKSTIKIDTIINYQEDTKYLDILFAYQHEITGDRQGRKSILYDAED